MQRTAVQSSNIKAVGYDLRSGQMEVEFNSGSVYRYARVPQILYQGLLAAPSAGSFFNDRIKGYFATDEVKEE